MGAADKPGHTCSFGKKGLIDAGTNCRAQSSRPGPVGIDGGAAGAKADAGVADGGIAIEVDPSLDAELKLEKLPRSDPATRKRISACIELLGQTPLPNRPGGDAIMDVLRALNQAGLIVYSEMEESFAEWDGEFIHINETYRFEGREPETAVELAHEGAHALWRRKHPKLAKSIADQKALHDINDEFNARKTQLVVYQYLRKKNRFISEGVYTDAMDRRLRLLGHDGDLRKEIEANWNH